MSPTSRTLRHLRQQGWLAESVERYIPAVQRKRDLFRVADVLAVHVRDGDVLLVQATSNAHVNDRLERIRSRWETALLLRAGVRIEVWGWDGPRLRRLAVRGEDLQPVLMQKPRRRKAGRQPGLFDRPGAKE